MKYIILLYYKYIIIKLTTLLKSSAAAVIGIEFINESDSRGFTLLHIACMKVCAHITFAALCPACFLFFLFSFSLFFVFVFALLFSSCSSSFTVLYLSLVLTGRAGISTIGLFPNQGGGRLSSQNTRRCCFIKFSKTNSNRLTGELTEEGVDTEKELNQRVSTV